jgi:hypothetical protein
MKTIIGLLGLAALVGCASAEKRQAALEARYGKYVGGSVARAIEDLGNPTSVADLPGAGKSYEWKRVGDTTSYVANAYTGEMGYETEVCVVRMVTDTSSVIRRWRAQGDCP